MIYGYMQKCDITGFDLISPKKLLEVNLSSTALSTFVLSGPRLSLFNWLAQRGDVPVKVADPLEPSRAPTTTIEIRRKGNFFLSQFTIIIRPSIPVDCVDSSPTASDVALDINFPLPIARKLILKTENSFKEILTEIKKANSLPSKIPTGACPTSYYNPAMTEMRVSTTRGKKSMRQRRPMKGVFITCTDPRYSGSDSQSSQCLSRRSSLSSLKGSSVSKQNVTSSPPTPKSWSLDSNFPVSRPLDRSSTMHAARPVHRNRNSPEPACPEGEPKPFSVAKRAILRCEYGVRRTRSHAK